MNHNPFEDEPTVVTTAFSEGSFFGNRFQIEGVIGQGGMSAVYRALDLSTRDSVALKVLAPSRRLNEELRARFRREAEILSSLDHPGVVSIRAFGHSADGVLWLAMELLEGETLRERIARTGSMDTPELVPIVDATCHALTAAHDAGVIHRDLKPDNLFLPDSGVVKVLDFGLSAMAGNEKLTATGTILGTPRYMAPEQIASAHAADARSDVYALAVITYEALAGKSPFVASDHGQLLGAILTGRRTKLREVRPELPEGLEEVLEAGMAKDPQHRYQTALDFADAFAGTSGLRRSSVPPPPRPPAALAATGVPEPRIKSESGRIALWIIAGTLFVVLGAAVAAIAGYLLDATR